MLVSPAEVELVKTAWEPGIRDPGRGNRHFDWVLRRFLHKRDFAGKRIADLGPGHYDFDVLLRLRGAEMVPLELDPAVIALGRHRGFDPVEFDLKRGGYVERFGPAAFDGVYCNGSIDCHWWGDDDDAHRAYVQDLTRSLKPDAWAFIAPCNTPPGLTIEQARGDAHARHVIAVQIKAFKDCGYKVLYMHKRQREFYGISTDQLPFVVFTRNLNYLPFPW